MNIVKITATAACGLAMLLLVTTFTIKSPETTLYKKTVELLMEQEGIASDQEVVECFPILLEIQSKIVQIADLKQQVRSQSHTATTEEETLQMDYYNQKIHQLQSGVKTQLIQLIATCVISQP